MPQPGKRIRGSAEERERARDRLRGELIATARALGEDSPGFDAVTIRSVADRVGYTAPIVYQYFANKRELLLAVVDDGFGEFAGRLGLAQCPDTRRAAGGALAAVIETYWRFATDNPNTYRLMHNLPGIPFGAETTPGSAVACFDLLKAAVAAEDPADGDRDATTELLWAQLHGMVSLSLEGRIKEGPARAHGLLRSLPDRWRPRS
ncbi:MAG: TetR/AcrR family transcriptional regulator [Stackebrandtia sp.]